MRDGYYNKQGDRISMRQWCELIERDDDYRRVDKTILPDGKVVSTVWLGHSFVDGPPMIFETMVFSSEDSFDDLACERYATLADAEAGHLLMCSRFANAA